MATLRDDLIPLIDEIRRDVVDFEAGLRIYTVEIRRRQWTGGTIGEGLKGAETIRELDPRPKPMPIPPRLVATSIGVFEEGDRWVWKISATETLTTLGWEGVKTGEQIHYLIDGKAYTLVREPEERYLEFRVHLRRDRTCDD